MPEETPRLGLKKPLGNETFNRASYSENLDILEAKAGDKATQDAHGQTLLEHDDRISKAESQLDQPASLPYHILRGQNIVDAVQESGISLKSIKGRTDINHVPLFDSGLWNIHANVTVDSPTKITLSATATHQHTTIQVACKPSTTYTISLLHSGYYNLANVDGSGTVTPVSNYRTDSTYTFTTNSTAVKIQLQLTSGTVGAGTYTFENIMLNEGSEARPFVANMKPLGAVMIENKGKNLLPPAPQATTSSFVTVSGEYAVTINGNNSAQSASFIVDAVPGQAYTLSVDHDGYLLVIEYDKNGAEVARPVDYQQGSSYMFTTHATTYRMQVFLHSNSIAQLFTFSNWTLNLGSEPLPFEPYSPSRIVIPEVGRSSVDGTVCDEVYERDGKLFRLQKFGYKVLDGSLAWERHADYTGYKLVKVRILGNALGSTNLSKDTAVKYDGGILSVYSTPSKGDEFRIGIDSYLYLSVSNIYSGWGESYTPSNNEIKAYFYGWKMYTVGSSPSNPFNGTGTQGWVKRYPDGSLASATSTLPMDEAGVGLPPYQLQYQLAQPVEVELADIGGLSLHAGLNQVKLSEGIVLSERVYPYYQAVDNRYYISVLNESSKADYAIDSLLTIYRNGTEDGKWTRVTRTAIAMPYGREYAYIPASEYNGTDPITIDYIALDKYLFTTNATESELEGQANLATSVGKNVRDIADVKRDVTVIERDFARKQQPGWIEPTLLNGWVNYGSFYMPTRYMKDDFGFVNITASIKSGTVGSILFYLPKGYRPTHRYIFVAESAGAFARVSIDPDGSVTPLSGANTSFAFFVRFRAEQ